MKTYTLKRYSYTDNGTFGVLLDGKRPLVLTLEEPWLENKRNVSCIPEGRYKCVPHNGFKYKDTWKLLDVPGRSAILIHVGNTILDTEGCILVGRGLNEYMITQSRNAMEYIKTQFTREFMLDIVDYLQDCPPNRKGWFSFLNK